LFLLQVTEVANVGAGREREKKLRISVQFAGLRGPTRRHRWGAWEDAPPLFLRFQKDFPAIPGVFRGCFVIFKLFNVIFCV
jgi:hypothetical protein